MKAMDFIMQYVKDGVIFDEAGNMYIDTSKLDFESSKYIFVPTISLDNDTDFISKEDYDRYNQYEIIVSDDVECDYDVRRPYYRMRGKPVTKEQAFDIIRRTDCFFGCIDEISNHEEFVGFCNFANYLINKNHYPTGYGWVHVDGTIGTNGITGKYPELYEYLNEWFHCLLSFPYLDLVIAITCWNEMPEEAWEDLDGDFFNKNLFEYEGYDKEFYDAVAMGIHVHDKTIEILGRADAVERYKEYASKYEKERKIYVSEYYMENGIEQLSLDDIKRCIESYGLNADEILSKEPENTWKNRDK